MEYENEKENKVGAGILTICILHFVVGFIVIGLTILGLVVMTPDLRTETLNSLSSLLIPMIIIILLIIASILLLLKKKAGVFLYFSVTLINIIINVVSGLELLTLLLSFILPILMAIFISKKKELYGFGTK